VMERQREIIQLHRGGGREGTAEKGTTGGG
jgi:hypothetical protein